MQRVLLGRLMCADLLISLVQVYHSPGLFVERQLRHAKKYKTAESPLLTPRLAHDAAALQHLRWLRLGIHASACHSTAPALLSSEGSSPPVHINIASLLCQVVADCV